MYPIRTVKLNDGNDIPVIAFGTGELDWHDPSLLSNFHWIDIDPLITGTVQTFGDSSQVVTDALSHHLVHLDCAWWYKNQVYTGKAIKSSALGRNEVFVVLKVVISMGIQRSLMQESFWRSVLRM